MQFTRRLLDKTCTLLVKIVLMPPSSAGSYCHETSQRCLSDVEGDQIIGAGASGSQKTLMQFVNFSIADVNTILHIKSAANAEVACVIMPPSTLSRF